MKKNKNKIFIGEINDIIDLEESKKNKEFIKHKDKDYNCLFQRTYSKMLVLYEATDIDPLYIILIGALIHGIVHPIITIER